MLWLDTIFSFLTPANVPANAQSEEPEKEKMIKATRDETSKEQEIPLFLGLESKYKWILITAIMDVGVTPIVCRDVFFQSCLSSISYRLFIFFILRLLCLGSVIYSEYLQNTSRTSWCLCLYVSQMLIFLSYVSTIIFSDEWGTFDVVFPSMFSVVLVAAQLHFLTNFQIDFEQKKSREKLRAEMKRQGKTSALEKDDERQIENKEADYFKMIKKLSKYFFNRARIVGLTGIGVVVTRVMASIGPLVHASILDALVDKDASLIKWGLLQYFIITIVKGLFFYMQAYYQRLSRELVEKDLRKIAFKKMLSMEVGYFDPLTTGEIMSTVYHHVGSVTCHLGWQIRCLVEFAVDTAMTLIMIFHMDHRLALCTCLVSPIMGCGLNFFNKHEMRLRQINRDTWTAIEKVITEAIGNIRTVKTFGAEGYEFRLFSDLMDDGYSTIIESLWYCESRWTFCTFIPDLTQLILMYYATHLVLKEELTMGQMSAFLIYKGRVLRIFSSLAEQMNTLSVLLIRSHKVFKLIDRECKLKRETPSMDSAKCEGKVELKNVIFAYPTKLETNVIHDISLQVNPGEIVALVGESGCGKTTIVKLMSYLYGPQEGSITLDDIPVGKYTASSFSDKVVCVPQEPVLFARSLHDNIAYGKDIPREKVIEAAKMANAHDFIMKQPLQYDSVVGERGITLSGGQRQRICIARALARNPNVLLLDEATASLDSKSERMVHKAVDGLIEGHGKSMSLVIVAHRLSTVKNADRIIVLDEGRIVEQGTHKDLMNANGQYAEFVRHQMLTEDEEMEEILGDTLLPKHMLPRVSA